MYYLNAEGEGLQGFHLIDNNANVAGMIRKNESAKKLVLTVMRNKRQHAIAVSPVKSKNSEKTHGQFR